MCCILVIGNVQLFAHPLYRFLGKPVVLALDLQQYLNQRAGFAVVLVNDLIDSLLSMAIVLSFSRSLLGDQSV